MKSQLSRFTFFLLICLILSTLNETVVANLNVGEPRTVRLFYFLPNDRPYRADVVEAMKTGIVEIQSFYAEQMEAHGHGRKTFQIETNAQGTPIVHRVDGDYSNSHYSNRGYTEGEIERAYDNSANVILIVMNVDGSTSSGHGTGGKESGWGILFGGWDWFAAAHELGHAFTLHHDFRDDAYIMSYGRRNRSSAKLSACAAEFLAVHPYFNPDVPLENESPPTVELISPTLYQQGAESVPIRLRVRDDNGLYQVLLFVNTKRALTVSGPEVKACRGLASETDTVVEFNYDGKTPSDRIFSGSPIYTSFSDPSRHQIYVVIVDTAGNRTSTFSPISFTLEEGNVQAEIVPLNDRTPQVRDAIVAAVPGINSANDVTAGHLAEITSLNLFHEGITTLKTGDFDGFTALTSLNIRSNQLSSLPSDIFDNLTALTSLNLWANRFTTLPSGIFDNLTALTSLDLWANRFTTLPSGIFDNLTGLTSLKLGGDFTTLPSGIFNNLTTLSRLDLSWNQSNPLPSGIFDNLSTLTSLNLWGNQLSSLPVGILDNLTGLRELHLRCRGLSSLPSGIFDNLTELVNLELLCQLTTLPVDIFDNLTALRYLNLFDNDLTTIPESVFDNLTALISLSFEQNHLTTLPSGIFDNLTALTSLNLRRNRLNSLPIGIFTGLTALEKVQLHHNPVNPLPLAVSLEKVGADQFKSVAPAGAPFSIVLPITVTNGSISGGATIITIPTGSFESGTLTVTRTPGTTAAVTVDIGTLPGSPPHHFGYVLVKSGDLPLQIISSLGNSIPAFDEGSSTTRTIAENTVANINIGTPITATDADNNALTYTLSGTDATSFVIDSTNGQLKTRVPLDYETKRSYTVTITVSDGTLTDSITVTINITDVAETPTETGVCQVGDVLAPGESCTYPGTDIEFSVLNSGRGRFLFFTSGSGLNIKNTEINGQSYTLVANKLASGSWEIEEIADSTAPTTTNTAPSFTEGTSTTRSVAENTAANVNMGNPIAATDATNDTLTYTLSGTDAASFSIESTTGQLKTKSALDYETKSTYIVTITVSDGTLTDTINVTVNITDVADTPVVSALTPVCDRTPQVRDAIVAAVPDVNDCNDVTETHLAAIITLDLAQKNIISLKVGDFDGLLALRYIYLNFNQLTSLPAGVFDGLSTLTHLWMASNQFTTLPAGVFDGLSALRYLYLNGNQFTSLPAGVFEGLSLEYLLLQGNAVDPLPFTVSLEKIGVNQFKATAPARAPFRIILRLSITNGSISGGTSTITIPAGSVESAALTVSRTPGTTAAVTVDIEYPLPELPTYHQGYTLVKSDDLPLEVISASTPQVTGVNIPDPNLRAKIETALGKASGDPISAAQMETLITLSAQDASIGNLTGLETATNLTTLHLGDNSISNISAIAGLTKLAELQLWDNQISNISALAGLTNLTRLYLWGNTISNISAVAGLTNLTHLYLHENSVSDISTIAGLTHLTVLRIGDNAITNISTVANLTHLVWLDAPNNSISDISAVTNLTNLTTLTLTGNKITDISAVTRLTKLIEVFLEENVISDLSPLLANTGLGENTEIYVQGNPLSYPSIYTHIPALQARNVYVDFDNRTPTAPVKISGDSQQGHSQHSARESICG